MKILKYKKSKKNEYKILTDENEYILYDDIIIKHELLLKKEISDNEWNKILKENNLFKAYYEGIKVIGTKFRTAKELKAILKKKNYQDIEIEYAIKRLENEGYLNHQLYIEAYIHDALALKLIGERKIYSELEKLGFASQEINNYLCKVDTNIYQIKIENYILKKLKTNKKSVAEFKKKIVFDLINKGFNKEDILKFLNNLKIEENNLEIEKIIKKLYNKYIMKYDLYITKNKIKQYLFNKGYSNIDIDQYLKGLD